MNVAVVIPTYNEKENIPELVDKIFSLKIPNLNIIFVDDNSPDGTGEMIKKMIKKYPIELIQRPKKLGLGSAYLAGFKKALDMDADYIFEMDADMSHDPKDIEKMLNKAMTGYNMVIGSRKIDGGRIIGWSWWRHFMSNGAMLFSRLVLGLKTLDVTSGFRCYHSQVLKNIPLDEIKSSGYAFQEEILCLAEKNGFSVVETPVTFNDRQRGKSKLGKKEILEFFKTMIRLKKV